MPRANRVFSNGHAWHLTHRCHKKEFLLKFAKDRRCWLRWLFKAKKRYGLCVLNYVVTSNHVHLLVLDRGNKAIPLSMQLIASQVAQRYNNRKRRNGAYWEDRYHATAVQTDGHLRRCLVYIDMNMIRAGAVKHPSEWQHGGYYEIQSPPCRCRIIDLGALAGLLEFDSPTDLRAAHRQWVEAALSEGRSAREPWWTEEHAVGSDEFVENARSALVVAKES